ncbi:MAG TPA: cyclic nucleotide-binding domain-containing protein [Polyangia bacterium]|jgi:hypothetical protein
MRIRSSVTSISWIPSEAVSGAYKVPFAIGMARYDAPPPATFADVETLRTLVAADRFRFANWLSAWIDVEGGGVVDAGLDGDGVVCSTTLRFGVGSVTFAPTVFPSLRPPPERRADGSVRFVQTCGGRTGVPAPRRVKRPPWFQIAAATAWTTLELVLRPDGAAEGRLIGASPFPRHWIYDAGGNLVQKSSVTDFKTWNTASFGDQTPWGDSDSPAIVHAVETALERQLAGVIMRAGQKPTIRRLETGETLCEQGAAGHELFLLLDGVLEVLVDDAQVAEVGPGAVLGERALLEGGVRTSTLRAVTPCRVAVASEDKVDRDRLVALAESHRREEGQ